MLALSLHMNMEGMELKFGEVHECWWYVVARHWHISSVKDLLNFQ